LYTYIETTQKYGFYTRNALGFIARFTFIPDIFAMGSDISVSQVQALQMHIKMKQGRFE
jgi:hypothetical protein